MNDPQNLCECGCGGRTTIPRFDNNRYGQKKGVPLRFMHGHNARTSPVDYLVDPDTGCWVWQRSVLAKWGYGIAWRDGKNVLAHRWFYVQANGPIPAGIQLDHLCRNRRCVNPEHLEPVTRRENVRRGANTKLTEEDARAIRVAFASSGLSKYAFAAQHAGTYGVSHHCIYDVLRGKTWQDVTVST